MATADGLAANLRLLHTIRVLLVSRDRRFLKLARFLLTRQGHEVDSTAKPGELFERLGEGANVVIVDASGSLASTARTVAEIEALFPGVGVVVVAEDEAPATSAFPLLAKWGSPDRLGEEVQRAYLGLAPRSAEAQ